MVPDDAPCLPTRDTAFFTLLLPQRGQQLSWLAEMDRTNSSYSAPHSSHTYS
jgi:hypothetical protein